MRRLVTAVLLVVLMAGGAASAQSPAVPPASLPAGMTAAQYQDMIDAIAKAVVERLAASGGMPAVAAAQPAAPAPDPETGLLGSSSNALAERFRETIAALPMILEERRRLAGQLSREAAGGRGLGAFLALLLLAMGLGLAIEQAAIRLLGRIGRMIPAPGGLGLAVGRLAAFAALDAAALAVLYATLLGGFTLWFGDGGAPARVAGAVLIAVFTWRAAMALFRVWIRPDQPELRIAPIGDAAAARLYRVLLAASAVLIASRAWIATLRSSEAPVELISLVSLVNVAILLATTLAAIWMMRAPMAEWFMTMVEGGGKLTRGIKLALARNWWLIAILLTFVFAAARVIGAINHDFDVVYGLGRTIAALVGLILFETLVGHLAGLARSPASSEAGAAAPPSLGGLLLRFLIVAVRIVVLVVVVQAWAVDVLLLVSPADWRTLRGSFASAGVTLLLAYVSWELVKLLVERQLAGEPAAGGTGPDAEESGPAPSSASRLRTMLPLLRAALGVTIVVLAILVMLSELGVNTAPLIAGASVFGLAISFGSQTLVKDIVSGVFFLADDAFRVGEYIDCGKAKGTVEGFTLRSIKLRHQNGQVHTIPFGQLGQVTNFSRDWITVKFNLRFARDTDLELLRKTTKKIGQEMMEDPELAPELIETLKMQGVADVADNALIVRFKFTAKPTRPSLIQRQAIKRMVGTFPGKGIQFSTSAVTVQTVGGGAPDPALLAAGAGAAASTPTVPVPAS